MAERYKAAALVEDMELYPRGAVSSHNITKMRESIRAGVRLDPVIADRNTRIIVDGFHRRRAVLAELGADADIEVVFKDYDGRNAILAEAIKINDRHGMRLTEQERVQCAVRCEELGFSHEEIAGILHVTVGTISNWMVSKIGHYKISASQGRKVALKPALRHLAGFELTREQAEANTHVAGNHLAFMAKQVRILVESGSVDWENEASIKELIALQKALVKHLPSRARRRKTRAVHH